MVEVPLDRVHLGSFNSFWLRNDVGYDDAIRIQVSEYHSHKSTVEVPDTIDNSEFVLSL